MSRTRKVHAWSLAVVCALIFVFSASAESVLRAVAQAVLPGATTVAQDPPPATQEPPAQPGGGRQGQGGGRGATPRPYTDIVTAATKTDDGVFKVHRNGDTVFYEIPKNELDKDFLWTVRIKKTTLGTGFGGREAQSRVVRWVKRGDRILLQDINFSIMADPGSPVAQAVADANYPAIIKTIPVAAYAPNGDAVIDVTAFFTQDSTPELSARAAVTGAGNYAQDRTFLESVMSFPESINAEVTMTFTGGAAAAGGGGGGRGGGGGGGMRGSSGTVVVAHSMLKLPERPMMSRAYDDRVGFANETVTDFGTDEHRSVTKRFIYRFRLDKKDPAAAMSDPVKPIVFYIDPATPAKFVPYVKRGVESWQAAFEAAGFRGAIQAKEAPKNDPEFSLEDARYSVVRWSPSNGEEQSVLHDPRSGEVISADVRAFPNVQTFGASWYLAQAGPLDKRAQQLPLPDDVTGELIRTLVAHQVGHTLGLVHNLKASSLYSVAQVRDKAFVKDNGYAPSIMDDAGFNYVAQPEDAIDPVDLFPKIGPYDKFAIGWGYRPVAGARTPDAEKTMLDQWAREQDTKPFLRFTTEVNNSSDPGESPETPDTAAVQLPGPVGDSDAVASSTLGLKNLARVSDMLLKATSSKVGDPWDDLEEVYGRMALLWSVEMSPVVRVIGGVDSQQLHIGQEGVRFKTVPKARQSAALDFLVANAFRTPAFMVRPEVLRRIQPSGAVDRVRTAQTTILNALLLNARIDRMTEQATLDPTMAYTPLQFLGDVRNGIWSELSKPGASIDLYRRNLQRAYLANFDQKLNGTPSSSAEIRALVKGELRALDRQLQTAVAAPGVDETTRRHINDCREEIKIILDPRVPRPAPDPNAAPAGGGRGRGGVR
jgi:hypothetical protein